MAPVKTAVIFPNQSRVDLIVPISAGATLKVVQDLAIERAAHHNSTNTSSVTDILLRLESQAGPLLHLDDNIEDVISAGETVFVTLYESLVSAPSQHIQAEHAVASSGSPDGFHRRVITPHLAHLHEDIRNIPLLGDGKVFSPSLALRDPRVIIANSLDIHLTAEEPASQERNCQMAEMSMEMHHLSVAGSLKVFVVWGFSNTAWVDATEPTYGSIIGGLRQLLGENFAEAKCVHLKGGDQSDGHRFTHLPTVSVSAKSRHSSSQRQRTGASSTTTLALDLHTTEGPIQTSCLNFEILQGCHTFL
jgi:hypothetical protein